MTTQQLITVLPASTPGGVHSANVNHADAGHSGFANVLSAQRATPPARDPQKRTERESSAADTAAASDATAAQAGAAAAAGHVAAQPATTLTLAAEAAAVRQGIQARWGNTVSATRAGATATGHSGRDAANAKGQSPLNGQAPAAVNGRLSGGGLSAGGNAADTAFADIKHTADVARTQGLSQSRGAQAGTSEAGQAALAAQARGAARESAQTLAADATSNTALAARTSAMRTTNALTADDTAALRAPASAATRPVGSQREAALAGLKHAVQVAHHRAMALESGQEPEIAPDFFTALSQARGVPSDPMPSATLMQADWLARHDTQAAGAAFSPSVSPGLQVISAAAPTASGQVALPIHHPDWGTEFGRQITAMAQSNPAGGHTIEMRLDPPDLGPIRISINLNESTLQAAFVSAHAAVRQSVENALPQLQQLLAQSGITLGQADVSDHSAQQQSFAQQGQGSGNSSGSAGNHAFPGSASAQPSTAPAMPPTRAVASNALIDTFA